MCRAITMSAAVLAAVAMLAVRWGTYRTLNDRLTEFVSVRNRLDRDALVVVIDASHNSDVERALAWRVRPFWHASGYLAADGRIHDAGNYELWMGYFPVIGRGIRRISGSPDAGAGLTEDERDAFATASDYLIVWSLDPDHVNVTPA